MRRDPTPAEEILWRQLRRRELGVRFRRQEPIGPFIADFACRRLRLIVEVDGDTHDGKEERDARRDRVLRGLGWRVLRVDNGDVYENLEGVLEFIWFAVHGEP